MEEKDLHRLKRQELLEILLAQSEEIDRLRAEIKEKDKQLADRRVTIQNAGSLATASLELTRVFVEAQTAADIYVANVKANADELVAQKARALQAQVDAQAEERASGQTSARSGYQAAGQTAGQTAKQAGQQPNDPAEQASEQPDAQSGSAEKYSRYSANYNGRTQKAPAQADEEDEEDDDYVPRGRHAAPMRKAGAR